MKSPAPERQRKTLHPLIRLLMLGGTVMLLLGITHDVRIQLGPDAWLSLAAVVAMSALFFGLIHLLNPQSSLLAALFIAGEAGVLLAAVFMLTRRLWLCIGIHIGWNFTQSAIFSGVVSGQAASPGLVQATLVGPPLLTGGAFGVEGSVVAFAVCLAAGLLMLRMAVRRGHVRAAGAGVGQP